MKTVITLITFLTAISIGSTSYAASKNTNATTKATLDEHVTADPNTVLVPIPVSVPRISTEDDEDVFAFYSDDGC